MNDTPQDAPELPPVIRVPEAQAYVIRDTDEETPNQRRSKRSSLGLLASMVAMMGATMPGMGGTPRVDKASPDYVKTPQDLARIASAQVKRDRRANRGQ